MGYGWWNPPTLYKEDCYWYREEQDMNAHIPYCTCKNQFPLNSCENCEDYHSRSKRTQGDKIRAMSDEELALYLDNMQGLAYINGFDSEPIRLYPNNYGAWLDWLRQEAKDG